MSHETGIKDLAAHLSEGKKPRMSYARAKEISQNAKKQLGSFPFIPKKI